MLCLPHPRVGKTAFSNRHQKAWEGEFPYISPDRGTQGLQRDTQTIMDWSSSLQVVSPERFPYVLLHLTMDSDQLERMINRTK